MVEFKESEAIKKEQLFGIPFEFDIETTAGEVYIKKHTLSTGYYFVWEIVQAVKFKSDGTPDSILSPTLRDVYIQIRDEYTTEDMFTSPVSLHLVTGQGAYQYVLPKPYMFLPGTSITVTITDKFGGSSGFKLQVVLLGYRIARTAGATK
ncbi:MAG: hypothetical protein J7J54_06475 [Candidatus Omnitrophica bacterium]|nr:hypothetical protein [Candidatus Omnitrophota bacterium]